MPKMMEFVVGEVVNSIMEKMSSFWGRMPIKDLHLGVQKDRLQVVLKFL